MRLIFMGTPDFAVPALDALVEAGHDIAAVYSQPPRPAGRGKALRPSPVQARAEALGLAVRTPLTLRDPEAQAAFAALHADAAVVAAYGLILPRAVLEAPRLGCLNLHASLLPRWRGAAPVQRAILAGDAETGICRMQMEAGLDTGPVRMRHAVSCRGRTAGYLTHELAQLGAAMIVELLGDFDAHPPVPQPETGITYASKIDKSETRIDFTRPAEEVERRIDAFNPPGAWFEYQGQRVRIIEAHCVEGDGPPGLVLDDALRIACGKGAILPDFIQRAGRGAMSVEAVLRGFPIPPGTQL
jgi:methionyl-tRNA formyltransferase